jgi:carbon-monoxide dehydrogenase medium subunit
VIPALGAYYRPDRLEEALSLLAAEPEARVLAGGTDLLLETQPLAAVVDISRLGLDGVDRHAQGLRLGAMLRIESLRRDARALRWADGVLIGACLHFGTLQVRNMASVGGNIAHALPAADLVPALLVLDASLCLARAGPAGAIVERRLPLEGFATAPGRTQLQPGELILEVRLPESTRSWRAQFRKIGRVSKDLAQANCAVALDLEDGIVRQARIAVGAVHPTVCRVAEAEDSLRDADTNHASWARRVEHAVHVVRRFIRPITDQRASAEWRRHVCGVLVARSLHHAADPRFAGREPRYEDGPLDRLGVAAEENP